MVQVPIRDLLLKFILYQTHKTIGLTIFVLALIRIYLRIQHGRPPFGSLPRWQQYSVMAVQALLYFLLVTVPVLGYFVAATAPERIPTFFLGLIPIPHIVDVSEHWFMILRLIHLASAWFLIVLAIFHATMGIYHYVAGIKILLRMLTNA